MIKKIILLKLKIVAKLILWKHKPQIIGITGSLGKTTTKDAIYKVLEKDFDVYVSEKSMNTDFGLPLTIMRQETPLNIRNIFAWGKVLWLGAKDIYAKDYPKILILEYGLDHPGDIGYLLTIAKPDISVITGISDVHLKELGSVENILKEKEKLITELPDAKTVLNTDFVQLKDLAKRIDNEKLTYGLNCFLSDADSCVTATEIKSTLKGLSFKINYKKKSYPLRTKLFGEHSVYSILSAFSVGIMMEMKPRVIIQKLKDIESTSGRMHILDGRNGSIIIDDSYNSSPRAAMKAIQSVEKFKSEKRIILVLGSMNELGDFSEEAHRKVGTKAGEVADILVTIGENAKKWIAWSAKGRGLTQVYSFDDPFLAGEYLKDKIQKDDLILIKGSQNGVFAEEVTKILMDEKYDSKEVLVRQTQDWDKNKTFKTI